MMCRPKPRSRAPVFLSSKLPARDAADVALLVDPGGRLPQFRSGPGYPIP